MRIVPFVSLAAALLLSACGVDTLTATATSAKLKAEEVKAGQEQMKRAEEKLNEIQKLNMDRLEHADEVANAGTTEAP